MLSFLRKIRFRLLGQAWPDEAHGLVQKHFKILPDDKYVPTEYASLLNDQEMVNMLSFRLALRRGSTWHKRRAIEDTLKTIRVIAEELEKRE